jgi:hypothetical protein
MTETKKLDTEDGLHSPGWVGGWHCLPLRMTGDFPEFSGSGFMFGIWNLGFGICL